MDQRHTRANQLVAVLAAVAFFFGVHLASAGNFPTSLNGFNDYPATNSTIYSADFNNVEAAVGTLTSTSSNSINYLIRNTSTPLGSIRGLSNVTGSMIYFLNSVWNSLSPGSSGQFLTVSSTAGVPVPYWSSSAAGATISGTGGEVLLSSGGSVATSSRNLAMNTTTMTLSVGGIASSSELQSPSGTITRLIFTNATGSNIVISSITSSTEIRTPSGTVSGLTFSSATGTNFFSTNVSSTGITFTNASGSGTFSMAGIASSSELRSASATLVSARDIQGSKYATSTPIQWIMENPTATEDDAVFIFNQTSTIRELYAVNKSGGDSVTFNYLLCSSRTAASSTCGHLFSGANSGAAGNVTSTASTTADYYPTLVPFASTTARRGDILRFVTTVASSSQLTHTLWVSNP